MGKYEDLNVQNLLKDLYTGVHYASSFLETFLFTNSKCNYENSNHHLCSLLNACDFKLGHVKLAASGRSFFLLMFVIAHNI